MSSSKAIGVFDSGLGGLTAVKQLINVLPNENIIYFGDTGRVPYGTRSRETIIKYAEQDARFLLSNDVKMLIAACGTVSSVVPDLGARLNTPYTGVVRPTAAAAVKRSQNKIIGVIGTSATINSHSYKKEISRLEPDAAVLEADCPLFVPLVENGFISAEDEVVRLVVARYLAPLMEAGADTVILGCTHYPILKEAISRFVGEGVALIDSGKETAVYAAALLKECGLLNTDSGSDGKRQFFVSDTPNSFESVAGLFLGENMRHCVTQIDIETY